MQNSSSYVGLRRLGWALLLGVLYYGGARLGLPLSFENTNATPIWPPAGIALAGLLLWGRGVWPGIWLAAFLANVTVFKENQVGSGGTIYWVSAAIACGNTLEALVGYHLSKRWLARSDSIVEGMAQRMLLGKLGAFAFAGMALVAGLASALIGPMVICASGIGTWGDFWMIFSTWWGGDSTAILVLTPFLLCFGYPFVPLRRSWGYWVETVAAFALLVLVSWAVFGEWFHLGGKRLPMSYLTIVPPVWIAWRVGIRGTLAALLILSLFAVCYTRLHLGPMAREDEHLSFLLLLGYLWVVSVANLTVACGEAARQQAQQALRELNEKLEQRVAERTSELSDTNEKLTEEMVARQRLEKEILGISEREQRRLGQDLHEGVSQHLAGVAFLCKVLADRLGAQSHAEAAAAGELATLVQESLDSTRNLAKSFYPVEFESGGLRTALQGLADRMQGLFGLQCELKCVGPAPARRDEDSAIHIYRIVQEALTNAIKHSRAQRVVIECSATEGREKISIIDDGVGFNPQRNSAGMGLHLMRYRARLIGAELDVRNHNAHGTVVCCSLGSAARQA